MPRAAGLLLESLGDLARAVEGLTEQEATARHGGASSIAWTSAHVTQMLESWILHRFLSLPRHPLFGNPDFGAGGSGQLQNWPAVHVEISDVHQTARSYLSALTDADLARTVPYDGSITYLRPGGLNLEYALLRIAAHHFVHAAEIGAVRSSIGRPVEDYPDWGKLLLG